jgi:plasmid stabilization system protein ParE
MAEVIWTEPALADVRRVFEFIADDSPRYAAITAERIMKSVDRLIDFPESGHAVPQFSRLPLETNWVKVSAWSCFESESAQRAYRGPIGSACKTAPRVLAVPFVKRPAYFRI